MGTSRRGRDELVELVDTDAPPDTTAGVLRPDPVLPTEPVADEADFETFYRRHFPGLVVLARVLAGPTLAEEVAQEAMLVACRKWDMVRDHESPARWVRTVCLRKAVSLTRRARVERGLLRQLGSFRAQDSQRSAEDERFWRAVRALPRRQGQVVALYYALDLTVADVARTLGCAEGLVRADLSRARTALVVSLGIPEEGMAIEVLARRMAQAARDDVHGSIDVEARLEQLSVVRRRRRRSKVVAGLVASAAVAGVVLSMLPSGQENDAEPAARNAQSVDVEGACPASDVVECLDGSTIRVSGKVPYTFTITPGFSRAVNVTAAPHNIDVFGNGRADRGVTIMTGVRPVDAPRVRGAEAVARWVGSREHPSASTVTRGTLDGLTTWSVAVRTSTYAAGPAGVCEEPDTACRPLLEQAQRPSVSTWIWKRMVSRYTFLDVPGLGTVGVWSWVFVEDGWPLSHEEEVLDRQDRLVRSIDFQLS